MAQRISFADRYQPDFGLPHDKTFEEKLTSLPEGEMVALAKFKAWLDGQSVEIAPTDLAQQMNALLPSTQQLALRFWAEKNAAIDPVQFGWVLESWMEVCQMWKRYGVHCIFGGNRSSKSVFAARLMVWLLLNIPEARIRCYQVNDEKSLSEQQAYIWEALPQRFKNFARKKGVAHSIQYSQKNGFTGGKLIIPPMRGYSRGGEMTFGTYQQYRNDPQVVEGFWAHAIWCDEEAPQKMFERLLTRLYDARGRMVLTFTTIQGWSPLVADVIGRVKTLRKRRATLLHPPRDIPVAQESISRPNTRIYYFWTQDNPFIPDTSSERLRGRPEEEILAVAYGIPSKPARSKFPLFDDTIHVIKHESMPWLVPVASDEEIPETTRYQIIDPSGSKPWFVIWIAVDALSNVYVYREWPDESMGAWGEPGESALGKAGQAQKPNGWGIKDYVELFAELEKGETIFERLIDPRYAASTRQAKEGAVSLTSELEDEGLTYIPAPGLAIDHGLSHINGLLRWDQSKPISALNRPKIYISDRCVNLIEAMKNYTGAGGDEVWKDPIDCVRYCLEAGADFIGKTDLVGVRRTFSY